MLDAVDDLPIFITKNNIAVLAHDLHIEIFYRRIAHFIQMLDGKAEHTFHRRLTDRTDASVSDIFAKEHTKIRRIQRAGLVFFCHI